MILAVGMLPVIMLSCARVSHERTMAISDARTYCSTMLSQVLDNELAMDEHTADAIAVMWAGSTHEHMTLDANRAMLSEVWADEVVDFDFAIVDDSGGKKIN